MKKSTLLLMVLCMLTIQLSAQHKNPEKEKESARLASEPSTISLEKLITNKSNSYVITKEHVSSISGIRHVYLRQAINGLEVYGTESSVHFDKTGKVLMEHNKFLADIQATVKSSSQGISARQAITSVAGQMGYRVANLQEIKSIGGKNKAAVFNKASISSEDIPAKLMYYYREGIGTYLVWELSVAEKTSSDWWNFRVDAASGKIIDKDNWTVSCNILGNHEDHVHAAKSITPFVGPMEEPINYNTANASNMAPPPAASYRVYAMPIENPNFGTRTLVTNPENLTASPFGWHDTNGVDGAEFTNTRGNNTDAYDDDNANNNPDGKYAFSPGGNLIFDFPLNTTYSGGDQSENAAITNLFYWTNIVHDVTYQYGFDEASGNFQQNNYGNGGLGNDPVNAEAQDGSGTCNANFGTPGDGSRPRMQMYVCSNRDGDLDNMVIIHEYGHGISNRLSTLSGQEQMGEGWSDFYGLLLTMESGDAGPDSRGVGTWLIGEGPGGPGIRVYPYSTNFGVNPHTYDDIKTAVAPHGVGEVWATMVWEMTWELIAIHGFDTDFYNGIGGNNIALALVTEGLKLQASQPGFVDGRDAILAADMAMYGGANQCAIWDAFARRGLGYSAIQGTSASKTDGTEAFDLPPTFSSLNTIDEVCLSDGIQTGLSGGNPAGGIYSGTGVTDDGNGTTFTFDPSAGGPGLVTVTYTVNDFCSGLPTAITDDINVTNDPPEIVCMGTGNIPMTGSQSSSPGTAIPDNNPTGVTVTMNVTENVSITDLDVNLNISHTWVGDLIVTIKSPAGTTAVIVDRPGRTTTGAGCSGNDILATLDDEAATPVENECAGSVPTINGSFTPNNPLSIFDGESTLGIWQLIVSDNAGADTGTINSWGIDYDYEVTAPVLDVTLDGSGNATVNAEDLLYSVAVDCGGYTVLAGNPLAATVSFSCSDTGLNTVAVEVTNDSGATSTCSAIVNVIGGGGGGGGPFTCPGDITQDNDPGICGAVVTYTVDSPSGCGGSGPLATGVATLELVSSAGGSDYRAAVSYNPSADRYYSVNGGNGTYPVDCFDGSTGAIISSIASGFDYRGAWWNPNLNQSEGNGYGSGGLVITDLAGDCPAGTITPIFPANQPDVHSEGDYDYDNNEVVYYFTGNITQVHRATGTTNAVLPLTNIPAGSSYMGRCIGYTGVPGFEYALYDNTTLSVHLYDRATGAYAATTTVGITPSISDSGFSYENGQAWIYANSRWSGFTIFGAASGTITQTTGLPSGDTFPVGTTTNTFEYDDGVNPVQTCSFDVTINDTEDPVITCPGDITVNNDPGVCGAVVNYTVTTSDNCSSGVSGSQTFSYTGAVDSFVVPAGVTDITIEAFGAQGGGSNGGAGGLGASISGDFSVTPGETLTIVVGQQGQLQIGGNVQNSSGGGGGSFVYNASDVLFVAAGGGGGKCNYTGSPPLHAGAAGQAGTSGGASSDGNAGGTAGNAGNEGTWSGIPDAGGGAGWLSVSGGPYGGYNAPTWAGGDPFCGGGGGGCGGFGGFGGGGGGGNHYGGGGGGGGYSGGGGGTDPTHGGGGGSFNGGTNPVNISGVRAGGGEVTISWNAILVTNQTAGLPSGSTFPVGTTTNTFVVTDTSGNTASCSFDITVNDTEAPSAVCQNINVQLDATGNVSIVAGDVDGGSTDACGIASTSIDNTDFTCADLGPNNVTLTVTDVNGNTSTCIAVVTVVDDLPPTITCPADITANTDAGMCSAIVTFPMPLVLDNCSATATQTGGLASGSAFPVGVNTVEFTATDGSGNTAVCSFTITVVDNEAPIMVCQNITIQLDASGNASITAADVDGGSTDNCGIASISVSPSSFDCSDVGDNPVVLTVTDIHGNSNTCTAIVTVEDVTPPVAVCQNITVELDPVTGTVTITGADVDGGSTDACGIDTYSLDVDTFDCSNIGDNTVVLTVTDVNGNVSTCTAIVTVEDNTSPELVCQDFTIEIGADGTATLAPSDVIASNDDACGILTVAVDITEFTCADIGTPVTVQVFSQDNNGNLSTCTAVVTAVDLLAPVLTCPADQTVDPGAGNLFYIVPDYFGTGAATAIDNCTDPVTITTQDPAAGTPLPDGVYTITLTATDEYGNTSTCEFELTVESILGVGDNNANIGSVQMYPNPAKHTVMIGNPASLSLENLMIFDIRGRMVKTIDLRNMGAEKAIDVSEMAAATYLVIIQGENGQTTKRLIKE
ncbi:M36 family metallopeptidase [Aequorivita antarctica]|nr:M36 family metallopeptidase [Aequorivita antarctica]